MAVLGRVGQRLAIGARSAVAGLFRGGRFLMRHVRENGGERRVRRPALLLPRDADAGTLGDALNRVAWYFGAAPGGQSPKVTVTCYLPEELLDAEPRVPDEQREVLGRGPRVVRRSRRELALDQHDLLLAWSSRDVLRPGVIEHLEKVRVVDPSFFSHRASIEFAVAMDRLAGGDGDRDEVEGLFRENMRALLHSGAAAGTSAALGTGPSLDEILEVDVSDTAVVVCNSIVKNDRLLEHLDPVAVCFGDPVFHFGPSEYAARFRDDLLRVIEEHDCFAVTHAREARLLLRHHPELEDRLVGLSADADDWTVPGPGNMSVRATDNILTLFMLPLASALADRVLIGGCDGREPDEDYFWEHNSSVQYEGLMRTVFESHPAFFRDRIYADYYDEHCRTLEEALSALEGTGRSYRNVTHSFIPALVRRSGNG